MTYRVEPLSDDHDLERFACGHIDLDEWLRQHARRAASQGTRTYVLIDETSRAVVGYFVIAPHLIERAQALRRVSRGAPQRIPAILLAKLALDERLQGQGLGAELLANALATIVAAARSAGGRIVVVDAIAETAETAETFYRAHDFEASPGDQRRLVMKLSTAARALGLSWP